MSTLVFPDIAIDLDSRIRRGEFSDRLPSARELAREYQASLQSVNNAVKPLIREGVLSSERRNGLRIHPEKLKRRLIAVVGWFSPENTGELVNYRTMLDEIAADGCDYVLLSALPRAFRLRPEQTGLFSGYDAVMFTNGSFHIQTAEQLQTAGVPFLADGCHPTFPDLNFVEFDSIEGLRELVRRLAAAGFRDLGLCWPSPRDGFNEWISGAWRKVKHQLGLPAFYGDRIRHDWKKTESENIIHYLNRLHAAGSWPELLIFWNIQQWRFGEIMRHTAPPPPQVVLLTGSDGKNMPENFFTFQAPDFNGYYMKMWKMLKKRILMPELPPLQQWLPYPVEFIREPIPKNTGGER